MAVVRNLVKNSYSSIIKEHWTADTHEELAQTLEREKVNYPSEGYGTMLYDIRQDPTGALWHAEFSRFTSCD
jgi:hypothetical protein